MKKFYGLIVIVCMLFSAFMLSGCETNNKNIKFWVDGHVYQTIKIKKDQLTLTLPDDPVKNNFTFDGWYLDDGVWEQPFTAELIPEYQDVDKIDVYAKWEANPDDANINYGIFIKNENGDYFAKVSNNTSTFNLKQNISTEKGIS